MTGLVNDLPEPLKRIVQGLFRSLPRGEMGLLEMVGRESGGAAAAASDALWGLLVVAFVDNLAKPYLMKDRMEVHGGVMVFALLGGLAFFGPSSLLAGPLIVAFFLAVVRTCRREESSVSAGRTAQ